MTIQKKQPRRLRKPASRLSWRRILVPVVFSKTSFRAFGVAVPLARDLGARLYLLTVIEPQVYPGGMEAVVIATPDSKLVDGAKAELAKIAKRFVPPSVDVVTLVGQGHGFEVITYLAKAKDIDLIVLASHGRTGLARMLMGSTAERVVRHAHCPVYVVRRSATARPLRSKQTSAKQMQTQGKGD